VIAIPCPQAPRAGGLTPATNAAAPIRHRILHAAGIELDPLRRTVTRRGHPIDLTVEEFAVLETLLKAAPAALSAEDLLAQAWDENTDPFTKTVQVTISRLRGKLGNSDPIQTIPGVGYRITDPGDQPRP